MQTFDTTDEYEEFVYLIATVASVKQQGVRYIAKHSIARPRGSRLAGTKIETNAVGWLDERASPLSVLDASEQDVPAIVFSEGVLESATITLIEDVRELLESEGGHTREACLDLELYLGNAVDEETEPESHDQTVECPECGRQYVFHYTRNGIWDPDAGTYPDNPPERFEEVPGEAYYGGQNYTIPVVGPGGGNYELVYSLDSLRTPDHEEELKHY